MFKKKEEKHTFNFIGLNDLELNENKIFVRKTVDDFSVDTKVVVFDTHSAILLKNGQMMQTLESGDYNIFDKNVGLFKTTKIEGITVDLIYVSKTAELQIKWGTPSKMSIFDATTNFFFEFGASGEFGVKVKNPRSFYTNLIGTQKEYTVEMLKERLKGRLLAEIEEGIRNVVANNNMPLLTIESNKKIIADKVKPYIAKMFMDDYGLDITYFLVSNIMIDSDTKTNYLKMLHKSEENETKEVASTIVDEKTFDVDEYLSKLKTDEPEKFKILMDKYATTRIEKSKYCSKCGEEIIGNSKFCHNCGTSLVNENTIICKNCGNANIKDNVYCVYCGRKL